MHGKMNVFLVKVVHISIMRILEMLHVMLHKMLHGILMLSWITCTIKYGVCTNAKAINNNYDILLLIYN